MSGLCLLLLGGCAAGSTVEKIADIALEATGMKNTPEARKPPREVAVKLHAGNNLNADDEGRPLAAVVRLYQLKQVAAFLRVPYYVFLDPLKEKEMLSADLLQTREIILTPGQRFEEVEKVTKEAGFIGVVTLFHSPAPQRWRMAFRADEAEDKGLILGIHSCAMTVGNGVTAEDSDGKHRFLAPARCQ